MNIRTTTPKDIDAVMTIIEEARTTIAALGIDQWQNGSPNRAMIEEDIALGRSYCVASAAETAEKGLFCPVTADPSTDGEGEVWGTFALIEDGEPTYGRIYDGQWLTPDQDGTGHPAYLAIHRVAIAVSKRGSGISTAIVEYAAHKARSLGRRSLRIDTHEGNAVMRRMLTKHGFVHCGTIFLQNGDKRVAYERVL